MTIPRWQRVPVVSGRTALRMLEAEPGPFAVSLDLGRSETVVTVQAADIVLPDGQCVDKAVLADAFSDPEDCVELAPGVCRKVYIFSDAERKYYKLYQPYEAKAPTIVINNATMHAIVGKDPWQDQEDKVSVLPRRGGPCLDTCAGLGYTAQLLARCGFRPVVTCEVDENVLRIAAVNPWSEGLFSIAAIRLLLCDVREHVRQCADGQFACIFHDPPTIYQSGELYSEALYREFARVLQPGGILYHYVGAPGRKVGRDYVRGVIRRLQGVGFVAVERVTSGVLARRPG